MSTDPNVEALCSALRALLIAVGAVLAANGYGNSGVYAFVEAGAGAVLIVGPAIWGVWTAISRIIGNREAVRVGVQAGIMLAASGQAVDTEGKVIPLGPNTTPPKPVTLESAKQIVENFGPLGSAR